MQATGKRHLNFAMTCVTIVSFMTALFCAGGLAFADDTGAKVVVKTPDGKPAEGSDVTLTPLFPKGSKGKSGKTDKDGTAAFPGLTEGTYTVTVVGGGTTTTYFIKVEKGKTTEQKSSEEGPPSADGTPNAATVNRLVNAVNAAAKACNKDDYDKAKAAFDALLKSVQAELDELEKLVNDAHEQNHFPTDLGGLEDMKSIPMEKDAKASFDAFVPLVEERDRVKAAVDLVKGGEKNLKPFPADCEPPKSGATEPPKTDKPPPSDKPR
jgi:hypothetical protein